MQVSPELQDQSASRTLPRPATRLHQRRSLLQANQASLDFAAELLSRPSEDPHGSVLRKLRQHLKRSPEELATSACLSVGQLHEIETGSGTLFYSPSLRLQAARRVARLLGTDWDAIVQGQITASQLLVNPRPGVATDRSAGRVISLNTRVVTSGEQIPKSSLVQLVPAVAELRTDELAMQTAQELVEQPLPLAGNVLLTTAAAEDVVVQTPAPGPVQTACADGQGSVRSDRAGRRWWVSLSLALVFGGAALFAALELGLISGVTLAWPGMGELL